MRSVNRLMFERTIEFCDSFIEKGLPGYDLAVYKDGECLFRHMNGYSDYENRIRIQGTEKYNIYSCSKIITCTAALQLWEKGYFSLEDKLADYMPEFKEMMVVSEEGIRKANHPILIKHLFEMTAGFSYDIFAPQLLKCKEETQGKCPTREAMKYLAKEPLLFEPGDRWEYSLCHDVLAALVEVISGIRFEHYVEENIFSVLGMHDSTFLLEEDLLDTVSCMYSFQDGKPVKISKEIWGYKFGSEYASGGAGAISTVDDCMKFLEGLRTYKLLKPETVHLMQSDRLNERQKKTYSAANTHGYGLGVRCGKKDGKLKDFGWGGAAGAYFAVDLEKGLSIYFATHLHFSPVQGVRSLIYRFVCAELAGEEKLEDIYRDLMELHDYHFTY